jgi:hypothetical protein
MQDYAILGMEEKTIRLDLKEVVSSPLYIDLVKKELRGMIMLRAGRKPAPVGFRYKRDWYDKMISENVLNAEFFLKHILGIWERASNINAGYRAIIRVVCDKALMQYLEQTQEEK